MAPRLRLVPVLVAAAVVAAALPAAAQGVDPAVVCATNMVPNPTRESRFFCEPMDSVGFVQFDQFLAGLEMLASEYPDFIETRVIGESVEGRPILFVEVTNEKSATPREAKLQLGYSASIHANEAAGREGMVRMVEDLAAGKGPYGAELKPLLDDIILNVWFPNPDNWAAGDFFDSSSIGGLHGGAGYARENANGYDLNRQFPNPGWILPAHEPMSQPEARAVVSELRYSGNHTNLVAGVDLHGMINSPNMVRAIIPNQDYDFRRMVLVVDQLREMQERVDSNPAFTEWNAAAEAGATFEEAIGELPVPCVPDPVGVVGDVCAGSPNNVIDRPFLWGARWDQIGYTDSGFTSDYLTLSPRSPTGGMGAVGQIVEFAYSHMVPDNKYVAKLTDMHVAGVREIVRTQMEQATRLESPMLAGTGAVGYVWAPDYVSSDDDPNAYEAASGKDFSLADDDAKFDFNQVPYKVSNLHFWRDLATYSKDAITPVEPQAVTAQGLANLTSLAITDQAVDALRDENIAAIEAWVRTGGHLLLTDGALRFFDRAELAESDRMCVYVGHSDLVDRQHPLLAGVDWNARVTGEGPAVGFAIPNEYPQWGLVAGSVARLGGTLAGTTGGDALGVGGSQAARSGPNAEACDGGATGPIESLGSVPLGDGRIDFLGAALPRPTQAYDHRYGLADYSVSALTYWVVMNSLGGHIEYAALDAPFVPSYDYDPLYGSHEEPVPATEAEKETPAVNPLVLLGAAVAAAMFVVRRRASKGAP